MNRLTILALAVVAFPGCSVLSRIDTTNERLAATNTTLAEASANRRREPEDRRDSGLDGRVEPASSSSPRGEVAKSIAIVERSNGGLNTSNENLARSNETLAASTANLLKSNQSVTRSSHKIDESNESMKATLAQMAEMSKGMARSNALMAEMNEKLGAMTKLIPKIPGLKP